MGLIEVLLSQFEDAQAGGFFFTAANHEQLIHRSKTFSDDSIPSGNGVAASVLSRLGYLLGELRYLNAAESTLKGGWPMLEQYPQAHRSLLNALEDFLTSTQILIIRGDAAEAERWSMDIGALYSPGRMILAIPGDTAELPPALATKPAVAGTVAYVCAGMTCSAPISDLGALAHELALRIGQGRHSRNAITLYVQYVLTYSEADVSRTSQHPKAETFNFRIDPALKAAFTAATEAEDKPAAQVLRDFMRAYVKHKQRRGFEAEAHRQSLTIAEHARNPKSDEYASMDELAKLIDADTFADDWKP